MAPKTKMIATLPGDLATESLEAIHRRVFELPEIERPESPPTLEQPHALRYVDSITTYGVGDPIGE